MKDGKAGLQVAKKWKDIAVEEIRKRLLKYKVHSSYELIRSVQMYVQQTGLNSYKATLLYLHYGIFPDTGAGRGQFAGEASVNKLSGGTRKKKPWTRAVAAETHRFYEIMTTHIANDSVKKINKSLNISKTIKINM